MARYRGPVGKVSRRLGIGITDKGQRILAKRPFPSGPALFQSSPALKDRCNCRPLNSRRTAAQNFAAQASRAAKNLSRT